MLYSYEVINAFAELMNEGVFERDNEGRSRAYDNESSNHLLRPPMSNETINSKRTYLCKKELCLVQSVCT